MKITIITINLNNKEGLDKSISSVVEQTYGEIEFMIIDGGSNDGSLDIIKNNEQFISYWVSEPDKGIYDAMNKAIDKATGQYLLFLNSGDVLYAKDVIDNFVKLKPKEDIVYGDSMFVQTNGVRAIKNMPKILDFNALLLRTLNHQSTFLNGRLFKGGNRYDTSYTYLADWVFYNSVIFINDGSQKQIDLIVSEYNLDGLSSDPSNEPKMDKERMRFYKENSEAFIEGFVEEYFTLFKTYHTLRGGRITRYAIRINEWFQNKKA